MIVQSTPDGGSIERDEIVEEIGPRAARSYFRSLGPDDRLIPNYDDLLVGDVILSRSKAWLPASLAGYIPSIQSHQESLPRFRGTGASIWSHAMLYVGRLHVAESQKAVGKRRGLAVSPLTKPRNVELMVCRRRDKGAIDDFESYRRRAALYALLDYAVGPRTYDVARIAAISTDGRNPLIGKLAQAFIRPNFQNAVICSEFVLESLAIGGKMLTKEWEAISSPGTFFYPADFVASDSFEKIPMTYLRLAT